MPVCCNGCLYVDLIPDCIDRSACWKVICCEACCATNGSNCVDKTCGICKCDCCPCLPKCDDCRYRCCVCNCCYNNIICDPCAFFRGPWEGDFNKLKHRLQKTGAPEVVEMIR